MSAKRKLPVCKKRGSEQQPAKRCAFPIELLPGELICAIIQYLPRATKGLIAALVCRQWRDVVRKVFSIECWQRIMVLYHVDPAAQDIFCFLVRKASVDKALKIANGHLPSFMVQLARAEFHDLDWEVKYARTAKRWHTLLADLNPEKAHPVIDTSFYYDTLYYDMLQKSFAHPRMEVTEDHTVRDLNIRCDRVLYFTKA